MANECATTGKSQSRPSNQHVFLLHLTSLNYEYAGKAQVTIKQQASSHHKKAKAYDEDDIHKQHNHEEANTTITRNSYWSKEQEAENRSDLSRFLSEVSIRKGSTGEIESEVLSETRRRGYRSLRYGGCESCSIMQCGETETNVC
jgi:hypothetical protein